MDLELTERRKRGGMAGAAAFVAGLVLTLVVENGKTSDDTEFLEASFAGESSVVTFDDLGEEATPPSTIEVANWIYHQAHLSDVSVTISGEDGAMTGFGSLDLALGPSTITYLIPLLVLGGAGFWLAREFPAESAEEAAKTGAHVMIGYLPLALLTALVFEWSTSDSSGTISVQPDLATALLFTGVGFPVVVGAVGGYVQHEYDEEESSPAVEPAA